MAEPLRTSCSHQDYPARCPQFWLCCSALGTKLLVVVVTSGIVPLLMISWSCAVLVAGAATGCASFSLIVKVWVAVPSFPDGSVIETTTVCDPMASVVGVTLQVPPA